MSSDEYPLPDVEVVSVPPRQLWEDIRSGDPITILDVRSSGEYEEWHLAGDAVSITNIPYYEFIEGVTPELLDSVPVGDPLVVVCAKGGASNYVAGLLIEEGRDAVNLAEGMNGWAEIYEAVELDLGTDATIIQYQRPSSGCLSYLVHDGEVGAVVDPLRAFAERYVEDAEAAGIELWYAFDTHVHADHLSGARTLADHGVEPVLPAPAADRGVTDVEAFTTATDGQAFEVGAVTVEALHTPGHTTGMTTYRVGGEALLTGDGLFVESVARPDLEAGADGAPEAAAAL
ncbi:MAG: MBL fold metallo-hydrolase [Halobacteriales archaeon]|nr:MBL fold metallo-hydrolase [Halobacteriales archaeon]